MRLRRLKQSKMQKQLKTNRVCEGWNREQVQRGDQGVAAGKAL